MGAWWQVAIIASLVGLWFSLSYLKRHNYRWGFSYIENHLYIDLLLKVQFCFVAYILLVGMFLGVKLATYTVEYAIYKSKFIGNKGR